MKRLNKYSKEDNVQISDISEASTSCKIIKYEPNKVEEIVDIEESNSLDVFPLPMKIFEHIQNIQEMRKSGDAPVDTMGCQMLADPNADPKTYRFQTLVALMLSSQTKDQVTSACMKRLIEYGCTIDKFIEIPEDELSLILHPVSFYKRKAIYLKKVALILRDQYDYDIPNTFKGLCDLPGVGPKMANLALQIAFEITEGIGVDTHVHRIANRLEWVKTKTPELTELKLQEILPKNRWNSINKLLVGFGQQICLPVHPKCYLCLNAEKCPWPNKTKLKKLN